MVKRIEINLDFDESTKTTGTYLVFDTETTGLPIDKYASPDDFIVWPYIVQIAWILFDDEHKLIEHNNYYLNQPVVIPADSTNIHGITTKIMLERGRKPSNVYANFKKAIDNTEYIIAHNIDFDIPIVQCEFLRNGMKWDFPNNKMLCTMKTGTNFCKITNYNGEYKWPKLTELYQNCFFPGSSMSIFSDAASSRYIHSANIEAGMTAQCFFKLKDLGFFKELGAKATAYNIPADQDEENFEKLNKVLDKWDSDNFYWSYFKIEHQGLGVTRVIKDDYTNVWSWKGDGIPAIEAQFKKWDKQWAKICNKKKLQAAKETSLKTAEEKTRDAQEKQKQIEGLLTHALNIDNTVNWDSLKDTEEFKVPNPKKYILERKLKLIAPPAPPTFRELPKEPDKGLYEPEISFVDDVFNPLKKRKIREAETLYQEAMTAWTKSVDAINSFNANLKEQHGQKIKEYEDQKRAFNERFDAREKDWEREKKVYKDSQKENNDNVEQQKEKYFQKNAEAIIQYCEMVLNNSQYPEAFPKDFDLDYNSDSKLLIVEYVLPAPDDFPKLKEVKYIAAKKELKESFLSETQLLKNYDAAIYKITLRTLHELFEADKAEALEVIIFNGWVNAINKATGKKFSSCIVTIQVKKIEFNEIELSRVDPKICFKHFNGIGNSKLTS